MNLDWESLYKDALNTIQIRELEIMYLKHLLDEAGISYVEADNECQLPPEYEEDQGSRIDTNKIFNISTSPRAEDLVANIFGNFFIGRMDTFAKRYVSKTTGKPGVARACQNEWEPFCHKTLKDGVHCSGCDYFSALPLTWKDVCDHIRGVQKGKSFSIITYPMRENETCKYIVFDFDNHSPKEASSDYANTDDSWRGEANAIRKICSFLGIKPVLVERSRSGRGAHVWIIFKELVPVKLARKFGFNLVEKGAEYVNLSRFNYFDRLLPYQDTIPNRGKGGVGNGIALPWQGEALKNGNCAFVDENWNAYPDQMQPLTQIWKSDAMLTENDIKEFICKWTGETPEEIDFSYEIPGDKDSKIEARGITKEVQIILADGIYIDVSEMTNRAKWQIRKLGRYWNKSYSIARNSGESRDYAAIPMYIETARVVGNYMVLLRGQLETLTKTLDASGIKYVIEDKRTDGRQINLVFNGTLKSDQPDALDALVRHENGILHAATGWGKTVLGCALIKSYHKSTLVVVPRKDLQEQWLKELNNFLTIQEDYPTYVTPKNRVKTMDHLIGWTGQGNKLTGIIDVAIMDSLNKIDWANYGLVIFDECHHAAAQNVLEALQACTSRYMYGMTATLERSDGREKTSEYLFGPVRYSHTAKERAEEQGFDRLVYPRFTRTVSPHHLTLTKYGHEAFDLLRDNDDRDGQIVADVKEAIKNGRTPLVITNYVEHANKLANLLKESADRVLLMTGKAPAKERKMLSSELSSIPKEETLVIVGTSKISGEGFNYPRLDALFLATPVTAKHLVEQYAGRIARDYDGKERVIVYDYVDVHIPKFEKMYRSRIGGYKRCGFKIVSNGCGEKQDASIFYDADSYEDLFLRDIGDAKDSVVISCPTTGAANMRRVIGRLKKAMESGLRATIVTGYPEQYKYGGNTEANNRLEEMRRAGIEVRLEDLGDCKCCAVIDGELVWYGSIKLLSKTAAEEFSVRLYNKNMASELLEEVFGKEPKPQEWQKS